MKVVIYDEGFIPGLGRGPFRTPIEISEEKFFLYKRLGLTIINASKSVPMAESGVINRIKSKINNTSDTIIEDVSNEEIKKEEVIETIVEEENTINDEIVNNENEEEVIEEEIDINTLTKKELIELLTESGIEINGNMNKTQLLELANEKL